MDAKTFATRVADELLGEPGLEDYQALWGVLLAGVSLEALAREAEVREADLELTYHSGGTLAYWEGQLGTTGVTGPSFLGVADHLMAPDDERGRSLD